MLGKVLDAPVVANDRCMVQSALKPAEVPQLQYFDLVVDVPVMQFIDKVWTSTVILQRQASGVPRDSGRCLRFSF